jgi:hypothetical protein
MPSHIPMENTEGTARRSPEPLPHHTLVFARFEGL